MSRKWPLVHDIHFYVCIFNVELKVLIDILVYISVEYMW